MENHVCRSMWQLILHWPSTNLLASLSHSSPWCLALPAGPRLSLLLACPGLTELCGRQRIRASQKGDAGADPWAALEVCTSVPTHHSLLLQATGGKTTTTAGLGPSPEPASRPQCYQHWGVVVFVGCHGLPKSHSGVKSHCPKFLGQK